jgi:hypothetical protein
MALAFALVAANTPERQAAAEVLEPLDLHGDTLIADTGFAGVDFEALLDSLGASFPPPDRQDERRRHDSLGLTARTSAAAMTRAARSANRSSRCLTRSKDSSR